MVEKAGKIIPHIMRVVKHAPRPTIEASTGVGDWLPTNCPACGACVRKENVHFYCTNSTCCPAQLEGVITAAAAKDRMNIPGLGGVLAAELVSSGLVKSLPDLWRLEGHREAIQGLERMGVKKTDKLLKGLEKAKRRPSWRLLSSLNIRMVGRTASEKICKAIHKLPDALTNHTDIFEVLEVSWDVRDLMAIDGIGEETATALLDWFELEPNQMVMLAVKELGLNCGEHDPKEKVAKGPQPLAGMKICATGKLKNFKRDEIKAAIKAAGGTSSSSVTKSLTYLIKGTDAGSKLAKAEALGVKTLTEAQFVEMLKGE
jgi:DNA ligase (NAD+)